jgi:hypothetical protein
VSTHPASTGGRARRRGRPLLTVLTLVVGVSALGSCGGGHGSVDDVTAHRNAPNPGAVPTLVGGIDLGSLDPTTVFVGAGLAFGAPLPSGQAAADAFTTDPEVDAAVARRVYVSDDGRHLADVVVLVLDGAELFDEGVLAAFVAGAVRAVGGGPAAEVALAGQTVERAASSTGSSVAIGFRAANLLVIVSGPVDADVVLTATRQLEARARGEIGGPDPKTPLVALPVAAAFVPVPTVTFAPIPPPDQEPPPEPPGLPGARALEGRYGVVAGERRTVVWAFAVDPAAYPSAEALAPAMEALAAARAGGRAPTHTELGGRLVYSSAGAAGTPSAEVFRHQGLVLLVEGERADQVDAVATAWIAALGPA